MNVVRKHAEKSKVLTMNRGTKGGGVKGRDWLDHKKMETQRTISRVGRGKESN